MAKLIEVTIDSAPLSSLWVEWNESNQRIQRLEWDIVEPGIAIRGRIWDSNQLPGEELVIDRTEGQGSGSINIPGNLRAVEVTDEDGTFWDLPSNITYRLELKRFSV